VVKNSIKEKSSSERETTNLLNNLVLVNVIKRKEKILKKTFVVKKNSFLEVFASNFQAL